MYLLQYLLRAYLQHCVLGWVREVARLLKRREKIYIFQFHFLNDDDDDDEEEEEEGKCYAITLVILSFYSLYFNCFFFLFY